MLLLGHGKTSYAGMALVESTEPDILYMKIREGWVGHQRGRLEEAFGWIYVFSNPLDRISILRTGLSCLLLVAK